MSRFGSCPYRLGIARDDQAWKHPIDVKLTESEESETIRMYWQLSGSYSAFFMEHLGIEETDNRAPKARGAWLLISICNRTTCCPIWK